MQKIPVVALSFMLAVALAAPARADLELTSVTGPGGLTSYYGADPFDPNNTHPRLQAGGAGSVENSGGVAVFDDDTFILDLTFLDGGYEGGGKPSYEMLLLTAATEADHVGFEKLRFFDPDDPSEAVEIPYSAFVDAEAFGLPFPPGGIKGIGDGAGDFLKLQGSLMAGVDLGVGLQRRQSASDPVPTVRVGVQVVNPAVVCAVRFDVFGLNRHSPPNIQGNNPNSGAAGYYVPEPSSLTLLGGGVLLAWARRRRKRR